MGKILPDMQDRYLQPCGLFYQMAGIILIPPTVKTCRCHAVCYDFHKIYFKKVCFSFIKSFNTMIFFCLWSQSIFLRQHPQVTHKPISIVALRLKIKKNKTDQG